MIACVIPRCGRSSLDKKGRWVIGAAVFALRIDTPTPGVETRSGLDTGIHTSGKGSARISAVSDAGNFGMKALDRVEREDPFLQVRPKASSQ
jgi:hypothetical protein